MEKKPQWLKAPYNRAAVEEVAALMKDLKHNTVCSEANCPNLGECFRKHTATFMILGANCTRNCRFCNIHCGAPEPVDPDEPRHLAEAAKKLGLKHVVVTMVLDARPDVLNHNVETVKELYAAVRPQAIYTRSLDVLAYCKQRNPDILVKTGFMVGLGETDEQIDTLMDDILATGCDILTIGQYLRPSPEHAPLVRYVTPEEFDAYKKKALGKGFKYCASTPLVRSSYRAAEAISAARGERA